MRTLIIIFCCSFFITAEAKSPLDRGNSALDSAKRALEKVQGELDDLQKRIKDFEVPKVEEVRGIDDGIAVAADPSIDPGIVYLRDPNGTPARKGIGNTGKYFDNDLWSGSCNSGSVLGKNLIDSALKALPKQEITIPDDSVLRAIPGIHIPKIVIPRINVPSVTIPEITVPEMTIPQITVPEMKIPAQHIEGITIPEIHVPGINIPEKHIKGMKIPKRHIKGFTIPKQVIPLPDDSK